MRVATQKGADPFFQKAWGVNTFRLGLASKSQQELMEKVFSQLPSDNRAGHTHPEDPAAGEWGNRSGG